MSRIDCSALAHLQGSETPLTGVVRTEGYYELSSSVFTSC